MNKSLKELLHILPELQPGERKIIGIDGLSRSGKTTLSEGLSNCLIEQDIPHQIFHIDDFVVERAKRYGTGHEEWFEYYCIQWDVDWLRQNFFDQLRGAEELRLPLYDRETDTRTNQHVKLPPSCLIFIDGVFLQRQEWRNFFDLMVYVDCQEDVRLERELRTLSKTMEQLESRYHKGEDYYLKTVNPKERADLIIKGDDEE
ncbi:kinase [Chungangia koreensis]|uniref:Kinase n=1 Tax=Chungangia koreensis TaxID=752657 RepID=A0ABV8X1B9_9LACT